MKRLGILALLLLGAHPAHAQTNCSVLSQAQLLNSFSDTAPASSITPRNMRDFVCSSALLSGGVGAGVSGHGAMFLDSGSGVTLQDASQGQVAFPGGVGQITSSGALTSLGTSLYPVYQTSTTVSCSITTGSNAFTCPANSAISVGDTVFPAVSADLPADGGIWPTVATYTLGTGTGTFSVNAAVTNASESLRFGSGARFSATASTMSNTLMAQTARFGDAAKNRTWWADNNPGYTSNLTNSGPSVEVGPNNGAVYALMVANRNTGSTLGRTQGLDVLMRADALALDFLGRRWNTWATYIQVDTQAASQNFSGTATAGEWEVANRWIAVPNDPYTRFPGVNNQTTVFNLGCGGGETATNAWGTLADCSSAAMIFANGAPFSNGIVFDSTALDTSGGPASAVAMAPSQALDWYTASAHPAWRIYSVATDAVNTFKLILDNSLATMEFAQAADFTVQSDGALQSRIVVNAHAGAQNASIQFDNADVLKWQVGNLGASNSFAIFDQTSSLNAFLVSSTGNVVLGETGKLVQLTNLNTTGTVAGALCLTSTGIMIYKAGVNCF